MGWFRRRHRQRWWQRLRPRLGHLFETMGRNSITYPLPGVPFPPPTREQLDRIPDLDSSARR